MWFEVDKKGLSKLLERKGKSFVLFELLQNAWDESTSIVSVTLARIPRTRKVELTVEDNSPAGFADLDHAFTLFAESMKKGDAEKRGRFNLGEKLTLSLCHEAQIISTTGGIVFDEKGRRRTRERREAGSMFRGVLNMTDEEMAEVSLAARSVLPPPGVRTSFNGEEIPSREAIARFEGTLPTEVADADGVLRKSKRKTTIEVFSTVDGEDASLYEMGIPVVSTGDKWHVNIQQKIPLSFDRDNVSPAYLASVRALVLEHMSEKITQEDANSSWVREAVAKHGDALSTETMERVITMRFGDQRVIYDPSDPEANNLAASKGYQVVHGSQMSKPEWDAVRRTGVILPAGRVTPSAKPYSDDPNAKTQRMLDRSKWTPHMVDTVDYIKRVAEAVVESPVTVDITSDVTWWPAAVYGPGHMVLNLGKLGHKWFDRAAEGQLERINELVLHELGHHLSGDHLSEKYHDALTKYGARLTKLALTNPSLFH